MELNAAKLLLQLLALGHGASELPALARMELQERPNAAANVAAALNFGRALGPVLQKIL